MEVYVLLFDDFDSLDAFGPADVLGRVPDQFHLNYVSVTGNIVNSMQGIKVWTEKLDPENIEGVLLIPGGKGARRLLFQDEETMKLIKTAARKATYCLMVANGSALLAQTGLLFRRKIADCSMDENWRRMFLAGVSFVKDASWMVDGKYYSSSDTISGISMTLGMVADVVDIDVAYRVADDIGFKLDLDNDNVFL